MQRIHDKFQVAKVEHEAYCPFVNPLNSWHNEAI